jgi:hypothetical protein
MNEAYQQGAAARRSGHPEPECPYAPGTNEYRDFASGFVEAAPLPMFKGEA